ncbi:tyrosine-type recombinase/integrase [Sinorhizobium saheli]|uniref:tyrosine-type recombinase/integrase n=1 Tax=Sinorhizobium saheli TaxID=36856 RepID=UPI001F246222|nr:tyrosine-type recombinase/integrase [Sinorhizobium saheli]
MILAKLGLRASEVAALNLDDIEWQSGTILVHGKERRQTITPLRHDVGTVIVAYIRAWTARFSGRRVFLRILAPQVSFASGCAITMIAKQALERLASTATAHHGAHLFRQPRDRPFAVGRQLCRDRSTAPPSKHRQHRIAPPIMTARNLGSVRDRAGRATSPIAGEAMAQNERAQ